MPTLISKETYFCYALDHLQIDMDDQGTFANVPSERKAKATYRVDIDESNAADVHATDCNCPDRQFRGNYCKHMQVVDGFYSRILAPYNDVAAAIENDKAYADVIDTFYAVRGSEIEAKKRDEAMLNTPRVSVAASSGASSVEKNLARFGFMK